MMTKLSPLAAAGLALVASAFFVAAAAQQTGSGTAGVNKSPKQTVQEIDLPRYPPEMPPGPNREAFQNHCLLCHSARYVTMQPPFTRTIWEKEVKKMVEVYGAPITPAEQQQVVDYLVAIKGSAEAK